MCGISPSKIRESTRARILKWEVTWWWWPESAQATDLMWQSLPPRGLTRWAMLPLLWVPVCSSADIPRLMEGSEPSALDSPTYGFSYAPIHLKSPWFSIAPSWVQPVLSVSVFFQCCELKTHAHNTWSRLYKWQRLTFLLRSHADTGPSAVTMCQCLCRHMFNTPALIHCQR